MPSPSRSNAGAASPDNRQVLWNHRVGSTERVASSAAWFLIVILASISVGDALAYATSTAQYRPSIKDAGVHQLELGFVPRTSGVLLDQLLIGKRRPGGSDTASAAKRGWAAHRDTTSTP